jgi:DNA-binding beta-propeller fold protein YncE
MILVAALFACDRTNCDESGTICHYFGSPDPEYDPTVPGTAGGVAGLANEGDCRDTSATYLPVDMTVGPDGAVYAIDWNNHRVVTFVPDDDQECETLHVITGTTMLGDGPVGPASEASWNHPTNIDFAPDGEMVIAAWHNSRVIGVDIDADTCRIIAGTGARNYGGDDGPAVDAVLDLPAGVAFDDDGLLYVADQANQRVRRIGLDGVITSIIGTGEYGYGGDGGPGTAAMLFNELSQAANPAGKLSIDGNTMYIADTGNHRIRMYDIETGIIDTFAGNGEVGYGGDGGDPASAMLNAPRDVEVGPDGAVYIADTGNHCVRVVKDGVISTFAGRCESAGYAGDDGPATEALLFSPFGLETDPADGRLYVADTNNHVIRTVAP